MCVVQELAMKLRAEGRTYNSETFNRKKRKAAGKADGQGRPKKKVKVKSSQRNKAPYNVSNHMVGKQELTGRPQTFSSCGKSRLHSRAVAAGSGSRQNPYKQLAVPSPPDTSMLMRHSAG
jgi:hypothetical protein